MLFQGKLALIAVRPRALHEEVTFHTAGGNASLTAEAREELHKVIQLGGILCTE